MCALNCCMNAIDKLLLSMSLLKKKISSFVIIVVYWNGNSSIDYS